MPFSYFIPHTALQRVLLLLLEGTSSWELYILVMVSVKIQQTLGCYSCNLHILYAGDSSVAATGIWFTPFLLFDIVLCVSDYVGVCFMKICMEKYISKLDDDYQHVYQQTD